MLKSCVSFVNIFIRVIKTGYNQLHIVTYYLPCTICNLEPQLSVTLIPCQSK